MKKYFFIVALLFTVICFASPPPLLTTDIVTDQVAFVVQNNVETVYTVEAQEVAFVYTGNFEQITCYTEFCLKQVDELIMPQATVADVNYMQLSELKKPPSDNMMKGLYSNFQLNKQHTNYGYPLTGDTQA